MPESLPDQYRRIWEKVYNETVDAGKSKEQAARIAWGAVERAGYDIKNKSMEDKIMVEEQKTSVEKADEISQDVEKLSKTLEEFGQLREAQKSTDEKLDKLFELVKGLQAPKVVKQEDEDEKKKKEENKVKEEEDMAKKKSIDSETIKKAIQDTIAGMGIRLPGAKPRAEISKGLTERFNVIHKAIFEENRTIQDLVLYKNEEEN